MAYHTCTSELSYSKVVSGYADWLNRMDWQGYLTLTTRYKLTVNSARKAADRLHSFLNKKYGNVRLFWVAEPFDTTNGYHLHALINSKTINLSSLKEIIKRAWQTITRSTGKDNKNTHVLIYDKRLGARHYVSKYINRKNADYNILLETDNLQ